jgi:hypothetical protein
VTKFAVSGTAFYRLLWRFATSRYISLGGQFSSQEMLASKHIACKIVGMNIQSLKPHIRETSRKGREAVYNQTRDRHVMSRTGDLIHFLTNLENLN